MRERTLTLARTSATKRAGRSPRLSPRSCVKGQAGGGAEAGSSQSEERGMRGVDIGLWSHYAPPQPPVLLHAPPPPAAAASSFPARVTQEAAAEGESRRFGERIRDRR